MWFRFDGCHQSYDTLLFGLYAKEKYRGVFEIQKSGDKTSSVEIGLDIRTHASPKVGQDQVSGYHVQFLKDRWWIYNDCKPVELTS